MAVAMHVVAVRGTYHYSVLNWLHLCVSEGRCKWSLQMQQKEESVAQMICLIVTTQRWSCWHKVGLTETAKRTVLEMFALNVKGETITFC